MKANLVAIDLAKSVFQVCVMVLGNIAFNRKMSRDQFTLWLAQLEPTVIAMEACATANFWGRKMLAAGHTVRLIPAQHVKAFCRVHKNDRGDAFATGDESGLAETLAVWRKRLDFQREQGYASAGFVGTEARYLALAGEREAALKAVSQAIDQGLRDPLLATDPAFAGLKVDRAFQAQVTRMIELINIERAKLVMVPLT